MVSLAWREELRQNLIRQGLPPEYIERLVQELCDHFNDIMDESRGTEAEKSSLTAGRVGQPSDLVAAAVAEHRKRPFREKKMLWKSGIIWEIKLVSVEAVGVGVGLCLDQFTDLGPWFFLVFLCVDLIVRYRHYSDPTIFQSKLPAV